jgi:hypothetical protein
VVAGQVLPLEGGSGPAVMGLAPTEKGQVRARAGKGALGLVSRLEEMAESVMLTGPGVVGSQLVARGVRGVRFERLQEL